jgi:DNA ligase-1
VGLTERAAELERLLPPELRVERSTVSTVDELTDVFDSAVARGFEGVVVKQPEAGYSAGRRQASWIKVKPRHTLDLIVVAVEWGYGRREGWLSNIHLAARDSSNGQPIMLGKTFKGMTDELLRWQTERFRELEERTEDRGRDAADRAAYDRRCLAGVQQCHLSSLPYVSIQSKHFSSPGIPPSPP